MSKHLLIPIGAALGIGVAAAAWAGPTFDPTRPNGHAVTGLGDSDASWNLNATRITPDRRTVVINGVTVAEGGRIGSARVVSIDHGQVLLDVNGKARTLRLLPGEVKTTR